MGNYLEEDWVERERREQDECYHGFDPCIDPDCRDRESCIGCPLLYPKKGEK